MDNDILHYWYEGHSDYDTPLYLAERVKDRGTLWDEEEYYPFEDDDSYEYSENPMSDEEIDAWEDKEYKRKIYISRDEKGRLKKESKIAKKRSCDEMEIWLLYSKR